MSPKTCSVTNCLNSVAKWCHKVRKVSLFKLPKDEKIRKKWLEISSGKLKKNKEIVFCEYHFEPSQVIRNDVVVINGEIVSIPHDRPSLRNGSVPSIFHIPEDYGIENVKRDLTLEHHAFLVTPGGVIVYIKDENNPLRVDLTKILLINNDMSTEIQVKGRKVLTEMTKTISSTVDVLEMMILLKERSICMSEKRDEECHGLKEAYERKEFCEPCQKKGMREMDCLKRMRYRTIKKTEMNKNEMRNKKHKIGPLEKNVAELKKVHQSGNKNTEVLKLKKENEELKREIEEWKNKLIMLETAQNIKQISIPNAQTASLENSTEETKIVKEANIKTVSSTNDDNIVDKRKKSDNKKEERVKKAKGGESSGAGEEPPVDVRRLDFRVGCIMSVKKHPDADSLYVEEIEVGEAKPRTVVSGLVKHVPINEMEKRMVVLLCNLKPAKMRGVTSEAMVMCASTPEKVEILVPPEGAVPGDLIHIEGYPRVPDPVLNPKKKIFETVAPDLKTNDKKVATFKGAPLMVPGKGTVISPSLVGVNIK